MVDKRRWGTDGETHLVNLPPAKLRAIERFVLTQDWEESTHRIDALELVLGLPRELDDDQSRHLTAHRHGKALEVYVAEDGSLTLNMTRQPYLSIPPGITRVLIDDVLQQEEEVRRTRLESLAHLLNEWMLLFVDDEKLIGHLLLAHNHETPPNATDEALGIHASLHGIH